MKEYEIVLLSNSFYNDYPHNKYKEILIKKRPFIVLLIKIEECIFAIPFRSNTTHKMCYKFKDVKEKPNSCLDFSKAVVLNKMEYIGEKAIVNSKEYSIVKKRFISILKKI